VLIGQSNFVNNTKNMLDKVIVNGSRIGEMNVMVPETTQNSVHPLPRGGNEPGRVGFCLNRLGLVEKTKA